MSNIIKFRTAASSPPQAQTKSDADDNVVPLPHVDLETVIEMVDCLRALGTYRQDRVREARLLEKDQADQAV